MQDRDTRRGDLKEIIRPMFRGAAALGLLVGVSAPFVIGAESTVVNAQHHEPPHSPSAPGHTDSEIHHDTTPRVSVSNSNGSNDNGRWNRGRWKRGNDNGNDNRRRSGNGNRNGNN